MNIINKILVISMLLVSFSVQAKGNSEEASLNSALGAYKEIQISGDFEKSVDYIYPPMFKLVSKEDTIKSLKTVKESGMAPKITKLEQKAELPLKKYSKGVYTNIPYTMELLMDFSPPEAQKEKRAEMEEMLKNPEELEKFQKFMGKMLTMSMGEVDIKFEKNSLKATLIKSGTYLAINEDKAGWKFLDIVPSQMTSMKEILPKEIFDGLKK